MKWSQCRKAGKEWSEAFLLSCLPYSNFFLNEEEIKPQMMKESSRLRHSFKGKDKNGN
jgi:hypothetical protein